MPTPQSKLVSQAIRLGIAYGPAVLAAAKKAGITPEAFVSKQMEKADAHKLAMEHADHLIDGSVLTVFEGDRKVYVVFSGDQPVATHPSTKTPLDRLVTGYDLTKRVRPSAQGQGFKVPKPGFGRRTSAGEPSAPTGYVSGPGGSLPPAGGPASAPGQGGPQAG